MYVLQFVPPVFVVKTAGIPRSATAPNCRGTPLRVPSFRTRAGTGPAPTQLDSSGKPLLRARERFRDRVRGSSHAESLYRVQLYLCHGMVKGSTVYTDVGM